MWRCLSCHSSEVEELVWVDLNTHEQKEGDTGENYCNGCESHVDVYFTNQEEDEEIIDSVLAAGPVDGVGAVGNDGSSGGLSNKPPASPS